MTSPDKSSAAHAAAGLHDLIQAASPRAGRRRLLLGGGAALALAGLGLVALLGGDGGAQGPVFRTQPVEKGELVIRVNATGTLHATTQVDVGSELSGVLESVLVQVNDRVSKGQVVARLDTSKLQDQVRQARASLASAQAKVAQCEATVVEAQANLARLKELARLSGGKIPARADLDTAEATALRAVADKQAAEASVLSARAELSSDEISLAKATVRSPINGVVLARKVEPGQTVAAAMTTPVLFTIAEDLRRMELQVDVDEADVGKVHAGQEAVFHVDAWPGQNFPAQVTRVGLGSQTKDNVVSYLTILKVANDQLQLRPGMTASAEITTARRQNALLVPNTALRYAPPAQTLEGGPPSGGLLDKILPRPPRMGQTPASGGKAKDGSQQIWLLQDGQPRPLRVQVLGSNGQMSEVRPVDGAQALVPGAQVIVETVQRKP